MTVDAIEFCAARQPSPLLLRRHESDRQPRAALATPPLQHHSAGTRAHAGSKPVRTCTLALFRLIGPLHRLNFTWTGAALQATAASGQYRSWASRVETEGNDAPAQDCGLPVQTAHQAPAPLRSNSASNARESNLFITRNGQKPHQSSPRARFGAASRCYNRAPLEGSCFGLSTPSAVGRTDRAVDARPSPRANVDRHSNSPPG